MINDDALSLMGDGAEYVIDRLTESEALKEIPIISSVVSLIKLSMSIPDRLFANKISKFLSSLEKYRAISNKGHLVSSDKSENKKIGEAVLNYLNASNESDTCEIIGFLYVRLKSRDIDILEFKCFCRALTMTLTQDIHDLIYCQKTPGFGDLIQEGMEVLVSTKLTKSTVKKGYLSDDKTTYVLTDLGKKFVQIMSAFEWEYEKKVDISVK